MTTIFSRAGAADRPLRLAVALLAGSVLLWCGSQAGAARVLLTDNRTLTGQVTGGNEGALTVGDADIPLNQIVSVDWCVQADPVMLTEAVVFTNGDRTSGKILSGGTASKQVEQDTAYGRMIWHAPGVSKLVFDHSSATWERVGSNLPVAAYSIQGASIPGDRVLVKDDLVRVTSQVFGKKDMERRSVAFVVLTPGERAEFDYRKPYVKVLVRNGDVLSGSVVKVSSDKLVLKLPFYTFPAATVEVPLKLLSRMIVVNGSVMYLSDLTPAVQKNIPYLFSFTSAARTDSAFTGERIRVGRRAFMKGLCTRARTELTYELGGKYKTFDAVVGVDDSIVAAGGAVRFLVYAESVSGRPLSRSELTPAGASRSMSIRVDVANVSKLILVTDWGPRGDIGAHGSWAAARLIKK